MVQKFRYPILSFIFAFVLVWTAYAQAVPSVVSIENERLAAYLDDADYDTGDYSYTNMEKYVPEQYARFDKPAPVVFRWKSSLNWKKMLVEVYDMKFQAVPIATAMAPADSLCCKLYNLVPGRKYFYVLEGLNYKTPFPIEEGSFTVKGRRRMIRANNVTNIRDFGGLKTDNGKSVRFERLYRGAALDHIRDGERSPLIREPGLKVFRDIMHIGAEIDLRKDRELLLDDADSTNDMTNSMLGPDVDYYNIQISDFGAIERSHIYGEAIATIVDCLNRGQNVYFHCAAGADRAGVLSFLLAAMMGVCENDLARDYELTSLCKGGTAKHTRNSEGAYNYAPAINYIKTNFRGRTLSEKVQDYLVRKQDVSWAQIMTLQRIMLE